MLIDRTILDEMASGMGRDQTAVLVHLYLRHTRDKLASFDHMTTLASPEEHRRAVHSLRGGSLQLGTDELVALCASLEDELRATGRCLTPDEFKRLRDTFDATHAALALWLGEGGASSPPSSSPFAEQGRAHSANVSQ